ncbi:MAG: GMC family oxidoreductase N-terminal domain-containing protein [Ferrovibrio sp.]|uniref:GMC family oxidoreductase n=1 Tax=Ferrovibrio sp. TaxID=1917215 RepID=UPI00261C99E8|nr:GMC family oxidoreductase N-terminal domain-containing protein [Ferrovibrio sp.]MCW0236317.1 GMC family oxidoreductase N-terminal domain-containing protein [Ferrovibrio sp.]
MPEEFDYIVVGAGAAGCVLAERLSANPAVRVALIEAGRGDRHPLHAFPMLTGYYYRRKSDNWFFNTVPQKALNDRTSFWPRGKRLGGSSIFNGMVYARGNAGDYNQWAQLGNTGWSYEDVLPYFKKNERHVNGESELHGGDGLVDVTPARPKNPLTQAFVQAGIQAGYRSIDDLNGPDVAGVGYYDFNMKRGRRSNSAGALLKSLNTRKNLQLIDNALVTGIVIENGAATGVAYVRGGEKVTLSARREVVLSAGAVGSPHILMLSGIGNPGHLKSVGIAPVHDLNGVGQNLIDHLDAFIKMAAIGEISLLRELRVDRIVTSVARAFTLGTGPVSESPISAGGYFRSREGLEYPDLQAFFVPLIISGASVWLPYTKRAKTVAGQHGYSLRIGPIRPQSRGRITLASPDPSAAPIIDPGYLSDPEDLNATVAGLKIARRILAQKAFEPFRREELAPGQGVTSDAELSDYVRATADTVYHPVGSARMGNDSMAVVDARLRVHGIRNLRVADASIMPTISSGNTNAPTMMIAEKAADMIHQDAKR